MHIINRRVHGILDYVVGLILILSPTLFGFRGAGAATLVPVVLGFVAVLYSLMTDYELGMIKVLSFRTHLTLDVLGGILLTVSPWLFAFASRVWVPHLILGLVEIGAVVLTRTAASESDTGVPGAPAPL
jgi:hypothetical protein